MKKCAAVIMFTVLVGATANSWAQTNDQLGFNIPITLKGTLSDKTKVTDATVGGSLSVADVQFIRDGDTQDVLTVIGNSISLLTTTNGGGTNTILQGRAIWTKIAGTSDSRGKFANAFGQDVFNLSEGSSATNLTVSGLSNSVLFVQGTETESHDRTNLTGKVVGIWRDGEDSVKGSIKNK